MTNTVVCIPKLELGNEENITQLANDFSKLGAYGLPIAFVLSAISTSDAYASGDTEGAKQIMIDWGVFLVPNVLVGNDAYETFYVRRA